MDSELEDEPQALIQSPQGPPGGEDFTPGERFELRRRLGAGGMGIVYEAFDRKLEALIAIKTLKWMDPESLFRFKREFRSLQDLHHPNLVRLGELIEHRGSWFFTMELLRGVDLLAHIRASQGGDERPSGTADTMRAELVGDGRRDAPTLDPVRLRAAFTQLARGLAALHEAGWIHRDIKPSNVLVARDGRVVILDFGLVADRRRDGQSTDANVVGTADYMAPEQAASKAVGPPADCYSAGVMLYEALYGRRPFAGTALEILMAKQWQSPAQPVIEEGVPSDLTRLCMRLLSFDPGERPSARQLVTALAGNSEKPPVVAASGPAVSPVFVGREDELLALRRAYTSSCVGAGQAAMVLVTGESGIGKTELVRQFVAHLQTDDDPPVVLSGRCYEREAVPYKAFDEVADSLSRFLVRVPEAEAAYLMPRRADLLARLFPVLGRVPAVARMTSSPRAATIDAEELRSRMFAALRELLVRLRDKRPVVVVIDDLQWTDSDSLVLLESLLRPPSPPPVVVIATARAGTPDELARLVPASLRRVLSHVALASLPPKPARELVMLMAPGLEDERHGAVDELVGEAAGHPLFLQELARRSSESGAPVRLEDALRARMERLSTEARGLLELLAVAGSPLPRTVLVKAFGQPGDSFDRALSVLQTASLARTIVSDPVRVETYHDRVRETAVASLTPAMARHHHGALAAAMLATGLEQREPARVIGHLEAADETDRAAQLAAVAAGTAHLAPAFGHAIDMYRTALRLGTHALEARRKLLGQLASALVSAGRGLEAAEVFLDIARGVPPVQRLDCTRRAIEQLLLTGHLERGRSLARDYLVEIGVVLPEGRGKLLRSLAWHRARLRLRGYGWKDCREEDIPELELLRAASLKSMAQGLLMAEPMLGALCHTRALLELLRLGEPKRISSALVTEVAHLAVQGGGALRRGRRLLEDLRARWLHAEPQFLAGLAAIDAVLSFYSGDPGAAADSFEPVYQGIAHARESSALEIDNVRFYLGLSQFHAGRLADAARTVADALHDAEVRGDRLLGDSVRLVLAPPIALVHDRPDDARAALAGVRHQPGSHGFEFHDWYRANSQGHIALYEGSVVEPLERLVEQLRACARSGGRDDATTRAFRDWLHAKLLLAAAVERGDPAPPGGIRRLTARIVRTPWGYAFAPLLRAALAEQQGHGHAAIRELRTAIAATCERMHGCAAAARYRLSGLLGGNEGHELKQAALDWASNQGVVAPHRFFQVLAPGFRDVAG